MDDDEKRMLFNEINILKKLVRYTFLFPNPIKYNKSYHPCLKQIRVLGNQGNKTYQLTFKIGPPQHCKDV